MGRGPDARLLGAVLAAIVFGAPAYAAIGAALAHYSPGPLALLRMLVASAALAVYAVVRGMRMPEGGTFLRPCSRASSSSRSTT